MALRADLALAAVVLRERLARSPMPRTPEPMVMDDEASVAAFDVVHPVLQLPVYRLSAEAASRLLPEGGTVLDLGSGTGRLLAHLARARPDVRAVGTDLAPTMLARGRRTLEEEGVADRVELREADMTALPDGLPERPDLLACVWALHHLPDEDALAACLQEVARVRERSGCAVWLLDFARLRRPATIDRLLDFGRRAPQRLREDGAASMRAAWTTGELRSHLEAAGLRDLRGGAGRVLGHVQAWWAPARPRRPSGHERRWAAEPLPPPAGLIHRRLRAELPSLPS